MFAYGANMHAQDMRLRATSSERIGIAELKDWKIGVNSSGWLGIAPEDGATTWGVIYQLGKGDEARLDEYEAVDRGLYRKDVLEVIGPEKSHQALVYVPNEPLDGEVRMAYLNRCIDAAIENALPATWIESLRRLGPTRP